jgi:hypothetical protein
MHMSLPINQHWVSQFYLRYFATPETRNKKNPKAWIFSKDEADGNETLKSIKKICGQRYLYTPFNDDETRDWQLEKKLDGLETTMGLVWPDLADGFVDLGNSTLRKGVSLFIAVMHLRNPAIRSFVAQLHSRLVNTARDLPIKPDGNPDINSIEVDGMSYPFDPSDWQDYRIWDKNDHDRFFVHAIQTEATRIANLLREKRWSIVFSERDVFVTSDKPVLLGHQSREIFGFGTEGTIAMFPISPSRLLVMDDMHQEPANQYYPLIQSNKGGFNYGIWHNGSRLMITGRPVSEVLHEILAWADGHEDHSHA